MSNENYDELISSQDNKVYFWSGITVESCNILLKKILEIENEYDPLISMGVNEQNIPSIELYINSPGGDLLAAFAIVDHILASKFKFTSIIQGNACSAATMISVVCDYRKIYKHSYMLIHELSSGTYGKHNSMNVDVICNNKMMNNIKHIYRTHTKINKDNLDDILKKDIYWNAHECLYLGLVDEIIPINKRKNFEKVELTSNMIDKCKIKK